MTDEQKARLKALGERFLAAPDPDDQPTRALRERAGVERSNRQNRYNAFEKGLSLVKKWEPHEATVSDLADVRRAERNELDTIATLEAEWIPPDADEKTRERLRFEVPELREADNALRAIRFGIEWLGPMEMIPPSLRTFLATECGWVSRDGAFWRGSISSLEDRLAEIRERLDPARAAIAEEMARTLDEVLV